MRRSVRTLIVAGIQSGFMQGFSMHSKWTHTWIHTLGTGSHGFRMGSQRIRDRIIKGFNACITDSLWMQTSFRMDADRIQNGCNMDS